MKLTKEERNAAAKTIRDADKLFDGFYDPKAPGGYRHDREAAYNKLRTLVRELLAKDEL